MLSGEGVFCKLSQELCRGDAVVATLSWSTVEQQAATQTDNTPVKEESTFPAGLPSEIQLLPQQAGMAAILATAVVNSEWDPTVANM